MKGSNGTLLVLGAGVFQVLGIRAAAARGLHVITADWDLSNPGHAYSHEGVRISTTDPEAILSFARERNIDGIVTFASDVATLTAAFVARELNLPGANPEAIATLSDKGRLRALQHAHGLPAPRFRVIESDDALVAVASEMSPTVMVKPVDSSGSRGITRVDGADPARLRAAFAVAQASGRSNQVCVEDFLPGQEVGGDGILVDGKVAYLQCTEKHRRGLVVTGHALPPRLSPEQQRAVHLAVEGICRAAGYWSGVVNFDVMVDGDRATVIEISPRSGGNGIPELLGAAGGINTVGASIDFALGATPRSPDATDPAPFGTAVFGSLCGLHMPKPVDEARLRQRVPEVVECVLHVPASGQVPPWDHGGASVGFAVFRCPDGVPYDEMAPRVRAAAGFGGTGE